MLPQRPPRRARPLARLIGALALSLPLAGAACDDDQGEARAYDIPKSPSSAQPAPTAAPAGAGAEHSTGATAADRPGWTVPSTWQPVPGDRPMRVATFRAGDASSPVEVSVTVFPGDTGGLLANVNRWRQQVGLGPIAEADLPAAVRPFTSPGFEGHTMRLAGPEQHLLGAAIYEPARDRTWFVKAVAPPAVADRIESEVEAFARSFGGRGPDDGATTRPATAGGEGSR